jgi:hypothetical protein
MGCVGIRDLQWGVCSLGDRGFIARFADEVEADCRVRVRARRAR